MHNGQKLIGEGNPGDLVLHAVGPHGLNERSDALIGRIVMSFQLNIRVQAQVAAERQKLLKGGDLRPRKLRPLPGAEVILAQRVQSHIRRHAGAAAGPVNGAVVQADWFPVQREENIRLHIAEAVLPGENIGRERILRRKVR